MKEYWHKLSPDEALLALCSQRSGLTDAQARERLAEHGSNELKGKEKTPAMVVFLLK